MTFRASAPHKGRRWLALLAVIAVGMGLLASTALAHIDDAIPNASFVDDVQGANDEPGQKDLTAQASAFHEGSFYSAWKWDDLSWSGKNTGDGCSLFNSGGNAGNVDFAVCATIGGQTPTLQTVVVYACSDGRPDRCTTPEVIGTFTTTSSPTAGSFCKLTNGAPGQFGGTDTQIVCNVSALAAAVGEPALAGTNLLNTCSYPSREPNSDPSDCVLLVPANQDVNLSTTSDGSITWTATLTDNATLDVAGATGSVSFGLYTDVACTPANLVAGSESTDSAGPSYDATAVVIDNTDVTGVGPWTFYWKVVYNPGAGFNGDTECNEAVTITADVTGSSTP
jgi:hypothetical protein